MTEVLEYLRKVARNSVLWMNLVVNSQILLIFLVSIFKFWLKLTFTHVFLMCAKERKSHCKVKFYCHIQVLLHLSYLKTSFISIDRLKSLTLRLDCISLGSRVCGILPWALIIYCCKDYWLSDSSVVWVTVFQ